MHVRSAHLGLPVCSGSVSLLAVAKRHVPLLLLLLVVAGGEGHADGLGPPNKPLRPQILLL